MKGKIYFFTLLVMCYGCVERHHHEESEPEHHEHDLRFVPPTSDLIALDTCRYLDIGNLIHTVAMVEETQGGEVILSAKADGILAFNTPNMAVGMPAKKGQPLFTLESGELSQNNLYVDYLRAEADYLSAAAELERKADLAEKKIITRSELQRAQTAYASALAVYDNLKENFNKGNQLAVSPVDGYVTRLMASNGEYLRAGQQVMAVSNGKYVNLRAYVQPRYYPFLSDSLSATVRLPGTDSFVPLSSLGGKTLSYGHAVEKGGALIPVLFTLPKSQSLVSGSFVPMYIKTSNPAPLLCVPSSALVEEMGAYFVYQQTEPDHYLKREVIPACTDGIYTALSAGLEEGAVIVSKGAVLIKLAQSTGSVDAHSGHVH